MTRLPTLKLSEGEETFALHMRTQKLNPVREFRFHPERKWRTDFAFPNHKLLIEIEGGSRSHGRHTRGDGFEKDAEKYNAATLLGYSILRYTTDMVKRGDALRDVLQFLKHGPAQTPPGHV